MSVAITCPVCGVTTEPAVAWEALAICGACGASLFLAEDGTVRRATAAETTVLSAEALQTLRAARGRIARPERRQR